MVGAPLWKLVTISCCRPTYDRASFTRGREGGREGGRANRGGKMSEWGRESEGEKDVV